MLTKCCSVCKQNLPLSEFWKRLYGKYRYGVSGRCKVCSKEITKNKATYKKEWKAKNKERLKELDRQYRIVNKVKIKEQKLEYEYVRRNTDLHFRKETNIRRLVKGAIRSGIGLKPGTFTTKVIGCTYEYLSYYLISKALMHYGYFCNKLFHIDHIIPLKLAKSYEDLIELNHYTNLQYLTPEDNYKKRDIE